MKLVNHFQKKQIYLNKIFIYSHTIRRKNKECPSNVVFFGMIHELV